MEHLDLANTTRYIPFERRMLLGHISETIGEPVLAVIIRQGDQDIVATSGINRGVIAGSATTSIAIEMTNSDVRSYMLDEYTYVAGTEEVTNYLAFHLGGWHLDAVSPAKIGETVSMITAAKALRIELEGVDLDEELARAWEAITELARFSEHQPLIDMICAVRESELASNLEHHVRSIVQGAESLVELSNQPLIRAYIDVLSSDTGTLAEELTLLQEILGAPPLEK